MHPRSPVLLFFFFFGIRIFCVLVCVACGKDLVDESMADYYYEARKHDKWLRKHAKENKVCFRWAQMSTHQSPHPAINSGCCLRLRGACLSRIRKRPAWTLYVIHANTQSFCRLALVLCRPRHLPYFEICKMRNSKMSPRPSY